MALRFGLALDHQGYKVFAMGAPGVGKHALGRRLLAAFEERAYRTRLRLLEQSLEEATARLPGRGAP